MIVLRTYEFLEDAWHDGVEHWCRSASRLALGGGQAWIVTVSDGQSNWIRRRLLRAGCSLFGVQFLDAAGLRQALCQRHGLSPSPFDRDTVRFTLRLSALELEAAHPEVSSVARHPGACLSALENFAAAGWLEERDPAFLHEILPAALSPWVRDARRDNAWKPEIDRQLLAAAHATGAPPLSLCLLGWDASFWPSFDLLSAALASAAHALVYCPLPRGSSETIQQEWLDSIEAVGGGNFDPCEPVGFTSAHAAMVNRLEGTDLAAPDDEPPLDPELLVGVDLEDTATLARDFVARWLDQAVADGQASGGESETGAADDDARLVILSPGRDLSAVTLLRALAAAGIAVEDELGEVPEPSLGVQIQRAVLAYHRDHADVQALLLVVELLNEHVSIWDHKDDTSLRRAFPIDAPAAREVLQAAFRDTQHHDARVLRETFAHARSDAARSLGRLVGHLGHWPELVAWTDALARWESCLGGLGLSTEMLEPLWSQLKKLPVRAPVPSAAFLQYLGGVLDCAPARRSPDGRHRYARVVMTTLQGALGQTWGAALFLDSNEGSWPLYPGENPFLDDGLRTRLNTLRAERVEATDHLFRGYLLTSSDRAQLEHFRFLEVLSHCTGPAAFAGQARDPLEPGKELYANEWALRCLLEGGRPLGEGEKLLDRWHAALRRSHRPALGLERKETKQMREVFAARRNPAAGFDEYGFNFEALTHADDLLFSEAWSAGDLDRAWNHPATFALRQVFGVSPGDGSGRELVRGESWMVGRLVHQWVRNVLGDTGEPRAMAAADWSDALTRSLPQARSRVESALRVALAKGPLETGGDAAGEPPLPLWWHSTLQKAEWATRRCLEGLAEAAGRHDTGGGVWVFQGKNFHADVTTAKGKLRLQARCDVVLSDRPSLNEARCQLIDIRTGTNGAAVTTVAKLEGGQGLNLAALAFLAAEEGARADEIRVGVVHPEEARDSVLPDDALHTLQPTMERLARLQHSLRFGQRANPAGSGAHAHDGETLPLTTVPIDPAVLARKFDAPDAE